MQQPSVTATDPTGSALVWQSSGDTLAPTISLLQHQGYRVTTSRCQHEAKRLALSWCPDVLVIHLQDTEPAAYELCQQLRKMTTTQDMPIVFVGARRAKSELPNVLRHGGNEYFKLPLDVETCALRLEQLLQLSKQMRKLRAEKSTLHQKVEKYNRIFRRQQQIKATLTQQNHRLQRLAFIDGLTQIANRRSFNHKIAQLWEQAYTTQQPLSLLLFDIDYFKRYNDTYGHPAGDHCLQSIAAALVRGAHRHSDQVARYGGEEFAILLPNTPLPGAQQVALSVQTEVNKCRLPHRTSLVDPMVSLSIGVCSLVPETGQQPFEVLIHGADEALYTAKLQGRKRIVANAPGGLVTVQAPIDQPQESQIRGGQAQDKQVTDRRPPTKKCLNPTADVSVTVLQSGRGGAGGQVQSAHRGAATID